MLSRHLLKALIGVVLLSVLIWLATIAGGISPWTTDPLPVNSQWSGSFAFHPGTLDDPDGDVQLLVTDRQGTSFRGVYETENKTYAWRVQGTLIHSQIRWEFVEAIRDSAEANVVGYAFVDGTLKDEMMTVTFRQPHEASVAAMRLQLRE